MPGDGLLRLRIVLVQGVAASGGRVTADQRSYGRLVVVPAHEHPLDVARLKAYRIFQNHPEDDVLACDTVVIIDGEILGKPRDEKEAFQMLKKLSGKKHIVLSGYTFINRNREINRTVRTEVYFRALDDNLILRYIKTGSPLDKAGAYGIQDDFALVERIVGSYDNVMGFPSEDIAKHCF